MAKTEAKKKTARKAKPAKRKIDLFDVVPAYWRNPKWTGRP